MSRAANAPSHDTFLADAIGFVHAWPRGDAFPVEDSLRLISSLKAHGLQNIAGALNLAQAIADAAAGHPGVWVRATAARAHFLAYANRFAESIESLKAAGAVAETAGLPLERGLVLMASVQPLCRVGRLLEALDAGRDAATLLNAAGATHDAAKARTNVAVVLRMQGQLAAAVEEFRAARAALAGDALSCAVVDSNTAEALLELGRFDEAEAAFRSAAAAFASAGHTHASAIVTGNLADLFAAQGRVDDAMTGFARAESLFRDAGSLGDSARVLAEAADAVASFGAFNEARVRYRVSVDALRRSGLGLDLARAVVRFAALQITSGNTTEARSLILEMLEEPLGAEAAPARAEATALLAIADLAGATPIAARGQSDAFADAMLRLADRPAVTARLSLDMAATLLQHGRCDDAAALVGAAETQAANLGVPTLIARSMHVRARLVRHRRPDAWKAAAAEAMRTADQFRGRVGSDRLRACSAESWHGVYADAAIAAATDSPPDVELVHDALERLKLRQALDASPAHTGNRDVDHRMAALRTLYVRLERADSAAARARIAEQLTAAEDQLHIAIGQAAASPVTRHAAGTTLGLDEVRARLPENSAAISYFADHASIGILLIRRESAEALFPSAPRDRVEAIIRKLRLIADQSLHRLAAGVAASRAPWNTLADELGALLLGPAHHRFRDVKTLLISPYASLHAVPFAALRIGGRPLILDHDLCIAHSLTRSLQPPPAPTHGGRLFVGVADEAAPHAEDEARDLARLAPGAVSLIGSAATIAAVREAATHAGIIHLATHCAFSPIHPESTRLKLADGWITARELGAVVAPGASIILAGCQTGRGSGLPGEENAGLIRTLELGGARGIVATLWPVLDRPSRSIHVPLHTELVRGRSAAPTLCAALNASLRLNEADGVHPALWGAFQSYGGPQ